MCPSSPSALKETIMTPHQIALVRETFAPVSSIADQAAQIFYGKLFERNPGLRQLFPSEMSRQRMALMRTIGIAVDHLDRLGTLVPMVEELGRRHVGYGVETHHYALVGEALLDTLREGLGATFTQEAEDAWRAAYNLLAVTMLSGAKAAIPLKTSELVS